MMKQKNIILFLILITFLLKEIFLVALFPIFKGQDEARHYNTIQYLANDKQKICNTKILDSTKQLKQNLNTYNFSDEIKETSLIAQSRKIRGNDYERINFLENSWDGIGEEQAKEKQIPYLQQSCFPDVVHNGNHFSFYHTVMSYWERHFQQKNIFFRFYSLRLISVLLASTIIVLVYYIFLNLGFSSKVSLILTAIFSFHPKIGIYFTNINYDIFLILFWNFNILLTVLILKKGWSWTRGVFYILSFILALATKLTALALVFPLLFLIYLGMKNEVKNKKQKLFIIWLISFFFLLIILLFVSFLKTKIMVNNLFNWSSFKKYLITTIANLGINSNYWGKIKWGGKNSYFSVYIQEIKYLEWLAGIGLLLGCCFKGKLKFFIKKNKFLVELWNMINFKNNIFKKQKKLIVLVIIYLLALQITIRVADYVIYNTVGHGALGMPARYWLPNLSLHLALLVWGWKVLIKKENYLINLLLFFFLWIVLFNFYQVFNVIIPHFYL